MPTIQLLTQINAPIEMVFDLSRSIDLHMESTKQTGEKAIAGKTTGLIELGETVTWQASISAFAKTSLQKLPDLNIQRYLLMKW